MKEQSFQKMVLGKLAVHMQKNEIGTFFNTIRKNQLKVHQGPIKLLEENIVQKLHNIEFGSDFLDMTPTSQVTKEKNRENFMKI